MPEPEGIIHSFRQRRQLEDAIAAFAATDSESALAAAADAVAAEFPSALVQGAVLRHLGTANSQIRGGIGRLSTRLPSAEIAPALLAVVGNRQKSPQERTAAALILERFLKLPAPPALLTDLAGNEDVPFQSLLEAVAEGRSNRHVLLEYVNQMQEHGIDVAFMVLGLIDRLPAADRVDLLRLIAQDGRPQVAHAAQDRLVQVAGSADASQAALRALHSLLAVLPADQLAPLERSLRKLQLGGHRYQPPAAAGWRAQISSAGPAGYGSIILFREGPAGAQEGALLGFILNLATGLVRFWAVEQADADLLPEARAPGEQWLLADAAGGAALMLEASFAEGLWLVWQVMQLHDRRIQDAAAAGEYLLYSDLIWQFPVGQPPAAMAAAWESTRQAPAEPANLNEQLEQARSILAMPAMAGWRQWSASIWATVAELDQLRRTVPPVTLIALVLGEINRLPDREGLRSAMAAGLQWQSLWFAAAGDAEHSLSAALLAQAMPLQPLDRSPFMAVLLEAGLPVSP